MTVTWSLRPSLNEIRSAYLGYFAAQDHAVIPSAPLVPQSDPTLLFFEARKKRAEGERVLIKL